MNALMVIFVVNIFVNGSEKAELWAFRDTTFWAVNKASLSVNNFGRFLSWSLGFEHLFCRPDSGAPFDSLNRFTKYWLELDKSFGKLGAVALRAGSFNAQIGKGFVINAVEDEDARLDRYLIGWKASLNNEYFTAQLFSGRPFSYKFNQLMNDTTQHIIGGDVTVDLISVLGGEIVMRGPGLSYMAVEHQPESTGGTSRRTNFITAYFNFEPFIYLEYVRRYGWDEIEGADSKGYAFYLKLGRVDIPGFPSDDNIFTFQFEYQKVKRFGHDYMLPPVCNHLGHLLNGGRDEKSFSLLLGLNNFEARYSWSGGEYNGKKGNISNFYVEYMTTGLKVWSEYGFAGGVWGDDLPDRKFSSLGFDWFVPSTPLELHGLLRDRREDGVFHADRDLFAVWMIGNAKLTLGFQGEAHGYSLGEIKPWVELRLMPMRRMELKIGVGRRRRELVCVSGICRYEPEIYGVKASLKWLF